MSPLAELTPFVGESGPINIQSEVVLSAIHSIISPVCGCWRFKVCPHTLGCAQSNSVLGPLNIEHPT